MSSKKYSLLKGKILYTIIIILIYLLCKNIPLYKIDIALYWGMKNDGSNLLLQTLGGDINQCTLLALGITPYMIASIFIQVIMSFRSAEYKQRTSPIKINKLTMQITLLIAIFMACVKVMDINFAVTGKKIGRAHV